MVMAVSAARIDWIAARQGQNHHFYQSLLDRSGDLRIGENIRGAFREMGSRFVQVRHPRQDRPWGPDTIREGRRRQFASDDAISSGDEVVLRQRYRAPSAGRFGAMVAGQPRAPGDDLAT